MLYLFREKKALLLNEITLRKKALLVENFPNQELIDEYLLRKDPVPKKIDIQWKQPHVNEFIVSFYMKLYNILIIYINLFILGIHGTTFIMGTTLCI